MTKCQFHYPPRPYPQAVPIPRDDIPTVRDVIAGG
jgi:hypothetical protein